MILKSIEHNGILRTETVLR